MRGRPRDIIGPLVPLLALATAAFAWSPTSAAPKIHVMHQDTVRLDFRPVTARAIDGPGSNRSLVLTEERDTADLDLRVEWPANGDATRVTFSASRGLADRRNQERILVEAVVRTPDGTVARARREIVFDLSTTALFEVYRHEGSPLTFAIEAEKVREEVLSARPTPGRPIQFLLEVQRVEAGAAYTVESNRLSTFAGESVSYSFRFGQPPDVQTAQVSLRPVEIRGELARVEIEVSGMLPSDSGPSGVARKDEWLLSRGSTSTLALETGDPPSGYRFRVTPRF